jgi:hypothetical protein
LFDTENMLIKIYLLIAYTNAKPKSHSESDYWKDIRLSFWCLSFAFIVLNVLLFLYVLCLSLCVYLFLYLFMLYDCLWLWFVYVWYVYLFICWFVIYAIYVCLIMCWFATFVHCYVFLKISSRLMIVRVQGRIKANVCPKLRRPLVPPHLPLA